MRLYKSPWQLSFPCLRLSNGRFFSDRETHSAYNSVLIRKVSFGEGEHQMHSMVLADKICVLSTECPFKRGNAV